MGEADGSCSCDTADKKQIASSVSPHSSRVPLHEYVTKPGPDEAAIVVPCWWTDARLQRRCRHRAAAGVPLSERAETATCYASRLSPLLKRSDMQRRQAGQHVPRVSARGPHPRRAATPGSMRGCTSHIGLSIYKNVIFFSSLHSPLVLHIPQPSFWEGYLLSSTA